jgi:hypothetical protein
MHNSLYLCTLVENLLQATLEPSCNEGVVRKEILKYAEKS